MKVKMVVEVDVKAMSPEEMMARGVDEDDANDGDIVIDPEEVAEKLVDVFNDKDVMREALAETNLFVTIDQAILTDCEEID